MTLIITIKNATLRIMILSITTLDTVHTIMLSVANRPIMLRSRYVECLYAECRYAECRGAIFKLLQQNVEGMVGINKTSYELLAQNCQEFLTNFLCTSYQLLKLFINVI
jgi:hypothetical protein